MPSYKNSDKPLPIMAGSPPNLVPPKMEWDRPPWNRWSFQHVREILPTVEVWRGSGIVREFVAREQNLDGLAVGDSAGVPTTLAGHLDVTYTDGFLVLKDGAIAYERYFNGMHQRTLHLSQSVAKSFTGIVAGILIERGILDVNVPVTQYLARAWKRRDGAGPRLQQVLDMTTGTRFSRRIYQSLFGYWAIGCCFTLETDST